MKSVVLVYIGCVVWRLSCERCRPGTGNACFVILFLLFLLLGVVLLLLLLLLLLLCLNVGLPEQTTKRDVANSQNVSVTFYLSVCWSTCHCVCLSLPLSLSVCLPLCLSLPSRYFIALSFSL